MDYRIFIKKGFTLKFEETIAEGTTSQIDVFDILDDQGQPINKLCVPHQLLPYATFSHHADAVIIEAITSHTRRIHEGYELLPGGFRHEVLSRYKTQ